MNKNAIPIILIVISIGIFYTFTDQHISQLQSIQATNAGYLSAINNSVQLISERDGVLKTYNTISSTDQARLNTMLPDNVDNVRLIIDISGIAARHGFSLQSISTSADSTTQESGGGTLSESSGGTDSSSPYGEVTISFTFTSSYQNFLAFLQDIQASLRILDITQLSVSKSTIPGSYNYSMELTTYWLK